MCLTTTIKILGCLRATYALIDFLFDCGNAFQATRTDDGTVQSEKLLCEQAPGFAIKDTDGLTMVCEILVALQGRVDAARLFGDRLEQIIFALGGKRSTWDPKPLPMFQCPWLRLCDQVQRPPKWFVEKRCVAVMRTVQH